MVPYGVSASGEFHITKLQTAQGVTRLSLYGFPREIRLRVPEPLAGTSRTFLLLTTGWYRIDTPNDGIPNVAALDALGRDPLAISRASVARLNAALARLAGGAQ